MDLKDLGGWRVGKTNPRLAPGQLQLSGALPSKSDATRLGKTTAIRAKHTWPIGDHRRNPFAPQL